jgi:hypothetical protein
MFDTAKVLDQFGIQAPHPGACGAGGQWSATAGRAVFDAVNPADGTVTARLARPRQPIMKP